MTALPMSESHQTTAPWAARLERGEATTLAAADVPRWLLVDAGCVWATRRNGAAQAEDLWIVAGQSLALPPGSAWVLEGWPQAQITLALQAQRRPPTWLSALGGAAWQRPWRLLAGRGLLV